MIEEKQLKSNDISDFLSKVVICEIFEVNLSKSDIQCYNNNHFHEYHVVSHSLI